MKLELAGITKSFGSHRVLDDISLELPETHAFVLIGPSGGGKSTLLRILAGLEPADAGSVVIDGETLPRDEEALRKHRRGVGIVFQAYNLFPHLSALENIMLPSRRCTGWAARRRKPGPLRRSTGFSSRRTRTRCRRN